MKMRLTSVDSGSPVSSVYGSHSERTTWRFCRPNSNETDALIGPGFSEGGSLIGSVGSGSGGGGSLKGGVGSGLPGGSLTGFGGSEARRMDFHNWMLLRGMCAG